VPPPLSSWEYPANATNAVSENTPYTRRLLGVLLTTQTDSGWAFISRGPSVVGSPGAIGQCAPSSRTSDRPMLSKTSEVVTKIIFLALNPSIHYKTANQ
jgi:hypothetical protein